MDKSNLSNTNGVGEVPPTEVVPKAKRRRFSASYKLRILNEAEARTQPGEITRLRKELKQSRQRLERAEAIHRGPIKVCTLFGISSAAEAGQQ